MRPGAGNTRIIRVANLRGDITELRQTSGPAYVYGTIIVPGDSGIELAQSSTLLATAFYWPQSQLMRMVVRYRDVSRAGRVRVVV